MSVFDPIEFESSLSEDARAGMLEAIERQRRDRNEREARQEKAAAENRMIREGL